MQNGTDIGPYSRPYQHQTWNHLIFDRIRKVQVDVELLKSYLVMEESRGAGRAGLTGEIETLTRISELLFEDVYKSIREKWV